MPASSARTLFVTTALPYANGPFHIGHIMEYIQADIWVRFQRMQGNVVHFVCADDTHGAPIMLKAESRRHHAGGADRARRANRTGATGRAIDISFDTTHSTHSPENVELAQSIYRALHAAGLIATQTIEQFYDPVKGMFLPDRYIKGKCPKCGAKDQFGDACEVCGSTYAPTDLIDPYSTLTGAKPELRESEHLFFRLSAPEVVGVPRSGPRHRRPGRRCSPKSSTRCRSGWATTARVSATGTSRATRPTSASRSRTSPKARRRSTSTSGSTRRSAISPR